ncbi:hypothetical protein ScalyP_jg2993 [Parmales sp. scaly parma]|nr:hypothetical protein ScalyP_jg2993 [Parmales sp. scaly parma]
MATKLKPKLPITLNVFKNNLQVNAYETMKFWFLLLSGVAIARILVFVVVLLIAGSFGALVSFGASKDPKVPFGKRRHYLAKAISLLARVMLFSLGFHWITIDNREKTKANVVAVGPHTGLMDSFFITWYFLPSPVSKFEVSKIPIFGSLCLALQTIFVDRKDSKGGPYSRKAALDTINRRAQPNSGFPRVVLFPEGTTTNGDALIEYKKGAFAPGQPVTPVLLKYTSKYYNPAAVGQNESNMSVIRCFFQFQNTISATVMDAYVPNEEEKKDHELFASNVRDLMAKELKIPTTEHSYADLFFQEYLIKAKRLVEHDFVFKDVKRILDLNLEDVKNLCDRFFEIGTAKNNFVSIDEFNALSVGVAEVGDKYHNYRERLFAFFCNGCGDAGRLEFKDFFEAVIMVSDMGDVENRINFAFTLFDTEMADQVDTGAGSTFAGVFEGRSDYFNKFGKDGKLDFGAFNSAFSGDEGASLLKVVTDSLSEKLGITLEKICATRIPEEVKVKPQAASTSTEDVKIEMR